MKFQIPTKLKEKQELLTLYSCQYANNIHTNKEKYYISREDSAGLYSDKLT